MNKLCEFCTVSPTIPSPRGQNLNATLLGAACCARLATILRLVDTCWDVLGVVGSNLKLVKFLIQHLRVLHDVVVWPGSCNNIAPGHAHHFDCQLATCRNRVVKRVEHVVPNNGAICGVEMLGLKAVQITK